MLKRFLTFFIVDGLTFDQSLFQEQSRGLRYRARQKMAIQTQLIDIWVECVYNLFGYH